MREIQKRIAELDSLIRDLPDGNIKNKMIEERGELRFLLAIFSRQT